MTGLVCGVGINDADYVTEIREYYIDVNGKKRTRLLWRCGIFERWSNMLYRCYSEKGIIENPTYKGVLMCDQWLTFSNFKRWVETQPYSNTNMELDKDILITGNKQYSPEACVFVPKYINIMFTLRGNDRGDWPLGVNKKGLSPRQVNESPKPFVATISIEGNKRQIGRHETPLGAHKIWQLAKADAIDHTVLKWQFDSASNHSFRQDVAEALWLKSDTLRENARNNIQTFKI
jgi:hypothetical protein